MQPSMFNLRVPLEARDDVFLMNTLTDAQLIVSSDVAALLDRTARGEFVGSMASAEEREALDLLRENGFLVADRATERRTLDQYLTEVKNDSSELNITLLTTLQCNFACDYCFQGDHGDYNKNAEKMSIDTAWRVAEWFERELDRVQPQKFVLTFFGGEPLLNLPVMYLLAERASRAAKERNIDLYTNIITNGLLLTPDVVDRMLPFGLNGVKITLDGDKDTHNRMRPLRGGQGTFDRIVENIRQVADRCRIAIGGNFDESSAGSYPALLDYLRAQDFGSKLVKVNFKPIVRNEPILSAKGIIPLTPVGAKAALNGTCMTSVGSGAGAGVRLLPLDGRPDDVHPRGDAASRLPDQRRRAQGHVPRAQDPRAHHRPGGLTLRVSRIHRATGDVHRPYRRPPRFLARIGPRQVRTTPPMERVRRLRVHPDVCRGLRGRIAFTAW